MKTNTHTGYKVCYKCRKKLPLTSEYFSKQKKAADGFDGRCKSCVNLMSKKYRENKGEQYRIKNISKAKEQQLKRIAKGQCRHCSSERLDNSEFGDSIIFTAQFPTFKEAEIIMIKEALKRSDNNQTIAAQLLGLTRRALNNRIQRFREKDPKVFD